MLDAKRLIGFSLVLFMINGCAVKYDNVTLAQDGSPRLQQLTPEMKQRIDELTTALIALDPSIIDRQEAQSVAHDAFVYPMYLANDWGLTGRRSSTIPCVIPSSAKRVYVSTGHGRCGQKCAPKT